MILNNYFNYKTYIDSNLLEEINSGQTTYVNIGAKDINGNDFYLMNKAYLQADRPYLRQNAAIKIDISAILGTGTTEPTATDYALQNDITENLSRVTVTTNISYETGKEKTVITVSGVNITGNELTISEIGIYKTAYGSDNNGTPGHSPVPLKVLFIRHLLETPKTVASGEGFSLTFEWVES